MRLKFSNVVQRRLQSQNKRRISPSRPVYALLWRPFSPTITLAHKYRQRLLILARTSSDHARICLRSTAAVGDKLDPTTVISRLHDVTYVRLEPVHDRLYLQVALINNRTSLVVVLPIILVLA